MEEQQIKDFCDNYILKSLIRQPTCYKSPSNPTCIYLILSNARQKFQRTWVLDTGLSDFHLMTVTVIRNIFKKLRPRAINYKSYKHFSNESYRESLLNELSKKDFVINDYGLQRFCDVNINTLNRRATRKRKLAPGNQMPFITEDVSKSIMKTSGLRNNFLKNRMEQNKTLYAKQRNYCVSLLKKNRKKCFANLNKKDILDNKLFWKTIKPSFPVKIMARDTINLSEKGELVETELETAEVLNKFFSNIANNLEISKYSKNKSFIDNIEDQTLRAILKYENNPSIIAIQNKFKGGNVFYFREFKKKEIQKEIHNFNNNKASQHSDIPTKITKSKSGIFSDFLYVGINSSIKFSLLPSCLKTADITAISVG